MIYYFYHFLFRSGTDPDPEKKERIERQGPRKKN